MSENEVTRRPTGRPPEGRSGRVLLRLPDELHLELAAKAGRQPRGRPGRMLVRMPSELHSELASRARAEGRSLNTVCVSLLAAALAWLREGAENCSVNSLCVALLTAASGWLQDEVAVAA